MNISQPEGGENGESFEVVNQWFLWRTFAVNPVPDGGRYFRRPQLIAAQTRSWK